MPGPRVEERHVVLVREIVAGPSLVTACGFASPVLFPTPAGRVVIVAVGRTVCAAWCTEWLARTSIAAPAALIYVLFVAHQPSLPAAWPYTPVIGFATMLGAGYRRLAHASHHAEAEHR